MTQATLTHRDRVAFEIVATEKSYVESLSVLFETYITPLNTAANNDGDKAPLKGKHAKVLFSNIELIYGFNQRFLADLEKRMDIWPTLPPKEQKLGDLFTTFAPFMKMYSQYCFDHEQSSQMLSKLISEKKFADFQKFCEKATQNPLTKGSTLSSYLIMPIQRVPRYKLLLEEMIKRTEADHPDLDALKKALETVAAVAMHINESIRDRENRAKVIELQLMFASNPDFVAPGRRFITQGPMIKMNRNGDSKYQFFLFNDLLAYASGTRSFSLHRKIAIDSAFDIVDVPDDGDEVNRLEIRSSQKSFIVICQSADEKKAWFEDIKKCKEEFNRTIHNTPAGQSAREAARWAADESAQECPLCSDKFSLFTRRHHCRKCGGLTCSKCSAQRMPIDGIKDNSGREDVEPKRVCDKCFIEAQVATARVHRTSVLPDSSGSPEASRKSNVDTLSALESKYAKGTLDKDAVAALSGSGSLRMQRISKLVKNKTLTPEEAAAARAQFEAAMSAGSGSLDSAHSATDSPHGEGGPGSPPSTNTNDGGGAGANHFTVRQVRSRKDMRQERSKTLIASKYVPPSLSSTPEISGPMPDGQAALFHMQQEARLRQNSGADQHHPHPMAKKAPKRAVPRPPQGDEVPGALSRALSLGSGSTNSTSPPSALNTVGLTPGHSANTTPTGSSSGASSPPSTTSSLANSPTSPRRSSLEELQNKATVKGHHAHTGSLSSLKLSSSSSTTAAAATKATPATPAGKSTTTTPASTPQQPSLATAPQRALSAGGRDRPSGAGFERTSLSAVSGPLLGGGLSNLTQAYKAAASPIAEDRSKSPPAALSRPGRVGVPAAFAGSPASAPAAAAAATATTPSTPKVDIVSTKDKMDKMRSKFAGGAAAATVVSTALGSSTPAPSSPTFASTPAPSFSSSPSALSSASTSSASSTSPALTSTPAPAAVSIPTAFANKAGAAQPALTSAPRPVGKLLLSSFGGSKTSSVTPALSLSAAASMDAHHDRQRSQTTVSSSVASAGPDPAAMSLTCPECGHSRQTAYHKFCTKCGFRYVITHPPIS